MVAKILGAQRDFSFGEVDVELKRADDHPARKGGLRQMANARILNSGSLQDRPGRTALYPIQTSASRTERFTISAGDIFDIQFAAGKIHIIDSTGAFVGGFANQGNGAALPWASQADFNSISYAILNLTITICFGHAMRPQVISWDGVSTWTIADYTELVVGSQKRTPFYRISPQGIEIQPSAQTGSVTVQALGGAPFVPANVGTRIRFVGRQLLITAFTDAQHVTAMVEEPLPGSQQIGFATDPAAAFSIGDVVQGTISNSTGIISDLNSAGKVITVQLLSTTVTTVSDFFGGISVFSFLTSGEVIVGPGGSLQGTATTINAPQNVTDWDDEVMNDFRGYPASVFVDQFRLGFCDFPSIPGGICWSAINSPTDIYVGANPDNAIFEIAPAKVRVRYVVPGPESSEFVFCDTRIYYIPISPTTPLVPGSVGFQLLSGDGSAPVQPRIAQEAILYVNAGQNSVNAVIATGSYTRPFNTKQLSEFHQHLFTGIQCIAAPNADGTFNERYAYVLNGDGSIAVGKYQAESLQGNQPVIGWGPWSGAGAVSWIAANNADVIFTSSYFGVGLVEILDDSQYLDCALPVNAAPAAFAPPSGKGPLWFIPSQTVDLMDQGTRSMGIYWIDPNGFIIPQFSGGENLAIASLVAGQPWTMTVEPFCPDASPGTDVGQRMFRRRVARFAACVIHSTGFVMARLFSGSTTPTSPAPGTVMNFTRFPAWNTGDDATKPPPQRETVERTRPLGRSYDPRVAIIKDSPGPLLIAEIGLEATI